MNLYSALAGFFLFVALQRISELWISARNARILKARGAEEFARKHFPMLVLIHVLFPIGVIVEVVYFKTRPSSFVLLWLSLFILAQILRYWAIFSLRERWNVRIWVVPGLPLVKKGPYRYFRHPNYMAVVIEILSGALLFGAWRTAIGLTLLNGFALSVRIREEEKALGIRPREN